MFTHVKDLRRKGLVLGLEWTAFSLDVTCPLPQPVGYHAGAIISSPLARVSKAHSVLTITCHCVFYF